jgi:hypothetical protein
MSTIKFKNLELKVDNNYYENEDGIDYEDFFNIKKTRNEENTDIEYYNCGGYALGTYSWYYPFDIDFEERCWEIEQFLTKGGTVEEAFEIFLKLDTEIMLRDFKGRIRVVENEDAILQPNEVLIAYRLRINPFYQYYEEDDEDSVSVDHDFHYLVRDEFGWRHKRGCLEPGKAVFTEEEWLGGYDGPIVFFAFQTEK